MSGELVHPLLVEDTLKIHIDPWTGRVLETLGRQGRQAVDPDRTSKVKVDPATGEVLVEPFEEAETSVETDGGARRDRDQLRLDLPSLVLVVAAALGLGAFLGSVAALLALA